MTASRCPPHLAFVWRVALTVLLAITPSLVHAAAPAAPARPETAPPTAGSSTAAPTTTEPSIDEPSPVEPPPTETLTVEPPVAHEPARPAEPTPQPDPRTQPTIRPSAPPAARVDAATEAAPPDAAPSEAPSPLRPRGEVERMAKRPLGSGVFEPGKGLTFATKDKRFSLTLGVVSQFLYTFNDTRPRVPGAQNTSQTFEVRRARFILQGNVFTPHIKYYAQAQFSPRDLGYTNGQIHQSPVFLWYATFDRFRDFTPQVGVQWVPYSHQRTAPITKLQFVDFSLASAEFGLERDIGVDFLSKNFLGLDRLRYHIGVFMGEGTDFAKPTDVGMLYVGRLEYLPFGDFDDYPEVDFNRRLKPKLAIAAAYAFDHADRRNKAINGAAFSDGGTMDAHNATADVVFKIAGFSMLGDFWLRYGKRHAGGAEDPDTGADLPFERARNGIGGTAQAGFLIPRVPFEIAGRYSGVRPIGPASSLLALNEAGPGLSYYFAEHSVKLQLDYFHGWGDHEVRSDRLRLQLTLTF